MQNLIATIKNKVLNFILNFFSTKRNVIFFITAMGTAFSYSMYRYHMAWRRKNGLTQNSNLSKLFQKDIDSLKLQMRYPGMMPYDNMNSRGYEFRKKNLVNNFNFRKYVNNKGLPKQDQVFFNIFQKMAVYAMKAKFA
jgi:hypothetical protein